MDPPRLLLRPTAGVSPLSPFWMRAVAFLIDAIVLGVAFQALWLAAPDAALRISPVAVWIQFGVAWLYFALANGPLGRGATLGKMALDLRTVRTDGTAISPGGSARRAALQVAPFVLVLGVGELIGTPDDPLAWAPVIVFVLFSQLGLGLLAADCAHLAMSPLGQAWHDRLVGTVTARLPIGSVFEEFVAANARATDATRRAMQFSLVALIAVVGMSSCQIGRHGAQRRNEDVRRWLMLHHEMAEEARLPGGLSPGVGRGLGTRGDDDITTGALFLYYEVRGRAPSDTAEQLEGSVARVMEYLGSDLEANAAVLFTTQAEDGSIEHRKDVQLREARAAVFESYPVLNVTTNRRKVEELTVPIRFPPDEFVEPAPPEPAPASP